MQKGSRETSQYVQAMWRNTSLKTLLFASMWRNSQLLVEQGRTKESKLQHSTPNTWEMPMPPRVWLIQEKMDAIMHCGWNENNKKKGWGLNQSLNSVMFWWGWGWTLVALGKEPECIDLLDEICHTSPTSQSKANNEDPYHNECVHCIHCCPAWEEERRLLSCILLTQELPKSKK